MNAAERVTRPALVAIVALQVLLLGYWLWAVSDARSAQPFELETRPLMPVHNVVISRGDLIDTINVFYGNDAFGRDVAQSDTHRGSFRSELGPDPGHFSWVMLEDRASPHDGLRTLGLQGLAPRGREAARFNASVTDGVLNFFYDVGGNEAAFVHNWSTVGVQELQMSPLMGWSKSVDFIILSNYDDLHCGGLDYLLNGNSRRLVLGPPLSARVRPAVRRAKRLRVLGVGLHRLTARLSMFVYPAEGAGGFEAAVLLRGRTGRWVLLAGGGGRPMPWLVEAVERAAGHFINGFVGAVGNTFEADDMVNVAALKRLRRSHPALRIVAGFGTTIPLLDLLSRVFGAERVQAAGLGARISISSF